MIVAYLVMEDDEVQRTWSICRPLKSYPRVDRIQWINAIQPGNVYYLNLQWLNIKLIFGCILWSIIACNLKLASAPLAFSMVIDSTVLESQNGRRRNFNSLVPIHSVVFVWCNFCFIVQWRYWQEWYISLYWIKNPQQFQISLTCPFIWTSIFAFSLIIY